MSNTRIDAMVDYVLANKQLLREVEAEIEFPYTLNEDDEHDLIVQRIEDKFMDGEYNHLIIKAIQLLPKYEELQ